MIVRAAEAADIPAMHRIRIAVRENRLSDPDRVTEQSYLPYVRDGSAWVAEQDGAIAGFAVVDRRDQSVWALFVDPEAEGSGVGSALHDRMLAWAAASGLRRLSLTTAPGTRAERFYAAAGWLRDGLTPAGEMRFRRSFAPREEA